jgi:hypothetical protein
MPDQIPTQQRLIQDTPRIQLPGDRTIAAQQVRIEFFHYDLCVAHSYFFAANIALISGAKSFARPL